MSHSALLLSTLSLVGLLILPQGASAHCQVPCGIYDDHARVEAMREDVTTISKAMAQIAALAGKRDPQSLNQLVRWVDTKEHHAEKVMRTIADYFLSQRIAPAAPTADAKARAAYFEKLSRHHAVMVAAMKCKQSAARENTTVLGKALDGIAGYWPAAKR